MANHEPQRIDDTLDELVENLVFVDSSTRNIQEEWVEPKRT